MSQPTMHLVRRQHHPSTCSSTGTLMLGDYRPRRRSTMKSKITAMGHPDAAHRNSVMSLFCFLALPHFFKQLSMPSTTLGGSISLNVSMSSPLM
ncbi:hypothetical protein VTN02DRAFT_5013 [Thermoascus thermophilus]